MSGLALDAPAKLNLGLRVLGRGADGRHVLESRLVLIDLADRLTLAPGAPGLQVRGGQGGDVPRGDGNLAWRGLLAAVGAPPTDAGLRLEKRIPVAAGLGGGSSDAAAAWRLGRAWRGETDPPDAQELGALAAIGADVPFFAAALPAADVGGIGERVTPAPPVDLHVLLVHPPFGLSTAEVFGALRPEDWGRHDNDLLPAALRLRPDLGDLIAAVGRLGETPRLSGSGSTLYVVAEDGDRMERTATRLGKAGVRVTRARTLREAASIERISQEERWGSAT